MVCVELLNFFLEILKPTVKTVDALMKLDQEISFDGTKGLQHFVPKTRELLILILNLGDFIMVAVALVSFVAFFIVFGDPAPKVDENKVEHIGGVAPYYDGHDDVIERDPHNGH